MKRNFILAVLREKGFLTVVSLLLYRLLLLWPHVDITKDVNGEKVLYLRRFFLFRSKWLRKIGLRVNWCNLYLHHIVRPDDDPDPHDHPWSFISLVLKGGYWDEQWRWNAPFTFSWGKDREFRGTQRVRVFSIVRRSAEHIHRVLLNCEHDDGTIYPCLANRHQHPPKPAWSLVLTGPYRRNWHFITERGPVVWWDYLNVSPPAVPTDDIG